MTGKWYENVKGYLSWLWCIVTLTWMLLAEIADDIAVIVGLRYRTSMGSAWRWSRSKVTKREEERKNRRGGF